MDPDLEHTLGKNRELEQNPMKLFAILLELCVTHLDEEIHELGVKLDGTSSEDYAQVTKEMAPEICGLRKACVDLIAICDGCGLAAMGWSQKLKDTTTKACAEGLRKSVQEIKVLVVLRLEKLEYLDGICTRIGMGEGRGRRIRHIEY